MDVSTQPGEVRVTKSVGSAPRSLISGPTISLLPDSSSGRGGLISSRGTGLGASALKGVSGFTVSVPAEVKASCILLYGDWGRADGETSRLRKLSSIGHSSSFPGR